MSHVELDSFFLIEFCPDNLEHQQILQQIEATPDGQKFLGNLSYAIQRIHQRREVHPFNMAYIVYFFDEPMGYISISFLEEQYQISYGIIPEMQGQYLGSFLLMEFSDFLFQRFPEIQKLILKIKQDNLGSIKLAQKVGYEKEDSETYSQRRI